MDSLTQAALGAVVGERLLGKQLGRKAILWGALVGTLPDLDVLVNPFLDPVARLYWHRGFSHSILGVLLGTPILAYALFRWWNRQGANLNRSNFSKIGGIRISIFVLLNFVTHILIDCFTVYGTQILEPFSNRRFGFNNFFIIDPVFTLPMLIWIVAALFRSKLPGTASPFWAGVCGISLLGYVFFSFTAQGKAKDRFDIELKNAGIEPIRGEISTAAFTTLVWRGLFETEDAFWISYWAINDSDDPLEFYRVPKRTDLLNPYRGDRAVECALWFSEGYLLVKLDETGKGFMVTDLRFGEFWPENTEGTPRTFFTWHVIPSELSGKDSMLEMDRNASPDVRAEFSRMINQVFNRMKGDRRVMGP